MAGLFPLMGLSYPFWSYRVHKMRYGVIILSALFWWVGSAFAQLSIGIGLPSVSIGINLPLYPELVRVPGYPVYYAPRLESNFFFYDGMYWVYQDDDWYASSWYNGPWALVTRDVVPLFVLRIPVRYYRNPPAYFHSWHTDRPPRWGEHWGRDWEQRRSGWEKWDRRSAPTPAPLPAYQRQYSGDRYPHAEVQRELHSQKYRYQPHDIVVREHYQAQRANRAPVPERQHGSADESRRQGVEHSDSPQRDRSAPAVRGSQAPQREAAGAQRAAPTESPRQPKDTTARDHDQQREQRAIQPGQASPRSSQENARQGSGAPQQQGRGHSEEKKQKNDENHGHGRNR